MTPLRQRQSTAVEPTALLWEQPRYIVSRVFAEVESVSQQGVIALVVPRKINTEDDPETGRSSCFLQTELNPALKVNEIGFEETVERLLSSLPDRDIAFVPSQRVGRIENVDFTDALAKFRTDLLGINGLDECQREFISLRPKVWMSTNQRQENLR